MTAVQNWKVFSSEQRNFHGYKVPSEYTENHNCVLRTPKGRFSQAAHFSGILSILENQLIFYISSGFQEAKALCIAESALNNSPPTAFCANWEHPMDHIGNIWGTCQKKIYALLPHCIPKSMLTTIDVITLTTHNIKIP
jgi:hypothetical protein